MGERLNINYSSNAWKLYITFLEEIGLLNPNNNKKRIDLLVDLLQKMANVLNYGIDPNHISSTCQSKIPLEHSEEQDMHIRQEMMEMLSLRLLFQTYHNY